MRRSNHTPTPKPGYDGFVLGRSGFAHISAVEGIALTPEMRATMDSFDRDGLTAAERRARIIAQFTPPVR